MFEENHIKGNDTVVIKIPPVEEWTLTQLRKCCKGNKVKGYTKMNRNDLIDSVKEVIKNKR